MRVDHNRAGDSVPADLLADPRLPNLAGWGRRLAGAGLSPGESGNMSCRTAEGFLITRTGVPLASIGIDDWVLVTGVERNPQGEVVVTSQGPHEPSRDSAVHASVYATRPEAGTIFHFHVGSLDVLTERLGVPKTNRYHPAGTKESMEEIERFLADHTDISYFVLVDHGIVALGAAIDETGGLVEAYQFAAEQEA